MKINIINLIDTIAKVNYGVWNAALINSTLLAQKEVVSYVVFPDQDDFSYPDVQTFCFRNRDEILSFLKDNALTPANTIVVSHGCWRWPTKMGAALKNKGYAWIAVPQGMLEPWSMQQKKLKKTIYYHLIEKQLLKKADHIRAVSKPEYNRLKKSFQNKVVHIPNGVTPNIKTLNKSTEYPLRFLFMARLHHKKGILPLVQAWLHSTLSNTHNFELVIAGPDDGELIQIKPLIEQCNNIRYLGAVYGEDKEALLMSSHVYVLPSYSEGFPSSVLEAMDYGLLPLISEGCNFPEAFEDKHVVALEPNTPQIAKTLIEISEWPIETIIEKGRASKDFVALNYTNDIVSNQLYELIGQFIKP
jgi:glycosyltransferase involved in cell wall biosynthesis